MSNHRTRGKLNTGDLNVLGQPNGINRNVVKSSKESNSTFLLAKDLLNEPGAVGISSDYKDHTDPKYIGPGTWNLIHRHAFKARTHDQQIIFIDYMKETCYGFPCTICMGHCTEYIKNHPMEEYLDVLVESNGEKVSLGLFVWSWKFHNAVNARINKPLMNWNTAYNLYSESESLVCSKNCLEAEAGIHSNDQPPDGLEHNLDDIPRVPNYIPQNNQPKLSSNQNLTHNFSTKISVEPFKFISIPRK